MKECQAGCKAFTGGEIRHHKDCVFYSESFSEMYDNVVEQNAQLRKEIEELKERHSAQVGRAFEKTQQITRLTELLRRAKEWIYDEDMISEIENAIGDD